MFRILRFHKTVSKLFRHPKYSTVSLQEINHNKFNLIQVKHSRKHEREKQEKESPKAYTTLLFTCSLGIALCEAAKLTQDEKRLLKACQYGLALEVKR